MDAIKTKFGSLQPLLKDGDNVVCELAKFHSEGSNHTHDKWEICFIQFGKGVIFEGDNEHYVGPQSVVYIPPGVPHRMKPDYNGGKEWEMLLVYSDQ